VASGRLRSTSLLTHLPCSAAGWACSQSPAACRLSQPAEVGWPPFQHVRKGCCCVEAKICGKKPQRRASHELVQIRPRSRSRSTLADRDSSHTQRRSGDCGRETANVTYTTKGKRGCALYLRAGKARSLASAAAQSQSGPPSTFEGVFS
jgi:hypothetical protein